MKTCVWKTASALTLLLVLSGAGCRPKTVVTWSELIGQLSDSDRIARLDTLPGTIITSYDRKGGNDDYNNYLREGSEPGWVVLADLKGPGYVSRFWMTGPEGFHRIRLYFDGEHQPRWDSSLYEICGQKAPFLPPLAKYENYCWYSFVPIPYAKRLVIEAQKGGYKPGGWPRLFYQFYARPLPPGQTVASFTRQLTPADEAALQKASRAFLSPPVELREAGDQVQETTVRLSPGEITNLFVLAGPAVLRTLCLQPEIPPVAPAERNRYLRDLVLRIAWNKTSFASVEVPVGDFVGSVWYRIPFQAMFFGAATNRLVTRFPMPFESAAEIRLANEGAVPLNVKARIVVQPLKAWDARQGYFHSGWYRTTPEDIGKPHPILRAQGKGKYVGCILTVTSADRSYWILEGDESIRVDRESLPGWLGTGLEDYFNGGWYYQNVLARPLQGLPFKAPFRTTQYRLHLTDAAMFNESLDMVFERGPDQASRGWMESVAFYYLAQPAAAFARLGTAAERVAVADPLAQVTLMTELWNLERFHDYQGASDYIDAYLDRFKDFPFIAMLRLRQAAYMEKMQGFAAARPAYQKIAAGATNPAVAQAAGMLLNYHENSSNALLGAYANTRMKVFLDGQEIGEAGDPERMPVWGLRLAPGPHVLALQAQPKSYPDWIQVCLRTHGGDVITTTAWKHAINPAGDWRRPDYDDSKWTGVGGTGCKGPPEEPHVWVYPDPFVDMQSQAVGLRPSLEWPEPKRGFVVYRHRFELPVAIKPAMPPAETK